MRRSGVRIPLPPPLSPLGKTSSYGWRGIPIRMFDFLIFSAKIVVFKGVDKKPMAKLVVLSNQMKGRAFDLTQAQITVGRLRDNLICLEDSTISGRHAELTRDGDAYRVRDLDTTNGTCVNGRKVTTAHLCHGDKILFGQLELEYLAAAKGSNRPLTPSPGKLINLSDTSPSVMLSPATPSHSPVTGPKQRRFKTLFQISLVMFGVVIIVLLFALILKIVRGT